MNAMQRLASAADRLAVEALAVLNEAGTPAPVNAAPARSYADGSPIPEIIDPRGCRRVYVENARGFQYGTLSPMESADGRPAFLTAWHVVEGYEKDDDLTVGIRKAGWLDIGLVGNPIIPDREIKMDVPGECIGFPFRSRFAERYSGTPYATAGAEGGLYLTEKRGTEPLVVGFSGCKFWQEGEDRGITIAAASGHYDDDPELDHRGIVISYATIRRMVAEGGAVA